MGTILSFFTGSGSVWKIVCVALLTAMLSLGVYTGVKISDKNDTIAARDKTITDNAKEYKEAIKEKDKVIEDKTNRLSDVTAKLDLQNGILKANEVQYEKNLQESKAKQEAAEKKHSKLIDWINNYKGDENATSCSNANKYLNSFPW